MAKTIVAAPPSLRTAALATPAAAHGSRPSSCRVWPPAPTYRASRRTRLFFESGACALARVPSSGSCGSPAFPHESGGKYDADGLEEHFEEEELRSGKHGSVPNGQDGKPVLTVRDLPERKAICDSLAPGFDYLEARITGTCDAQYRLGDMYELCRVARAFDPSFAKDHLDAAFVDAMSAITPLNALGMLDDLKQQVPQYLAAAAATAPDFDRASVADYSEAILGWWRANGSMFPAWALAARIVFAISPNSAACERVFALLKNLFGDEQMSALADYVQAALMLNYHGRRVG